MVSCFSANKQFNVEKHADTFQKNIKWIRLSKNTLFKKAPRVEPVEEDRVDIDAALHDAAATAWRTARLLQINFKITSKSYAMD